MRVKIIDPVFSDRFFRALSTNWDQHYRFRRIFYTDRSINLICYILADAVHGR